MIMGVKRIFVDTSVLIYSTNALSPWRKMAINALQKARNLEFELVVSRQVFQEYLAIITCPDQNNDVPPVPRIIENIRIFQGEFTVVGGKQETMPTLLELLQEFPVRGKEIYNASIVATMLVYGIEHLLTNNVDDFKCFAEKIHILPLEKWANM